MDNFCILNVHNYLNFKSMKKSYLLSLCLILFISGFYIEASAQDVKNQTIKKEVKTNQLAKTQQATLVSIFQVNFNTVDENLQQFLGKNENVLHFKQEAETNSFVLYLPEGNTKTDLNHLLKSNEIVEFKILKFQQGGRKANLFNKRF